MAHNARNFNFGIKIYLNKVSLCFGLKRGLLVKLTLLNITFIMLHLSLPIIHEICDSYWPGIVNIKQYGAFYSLWSEVSIGSYFVYLLEISAAFLFFYC